jgi:hypothetical protein
VLNHLIRTENSVTPKILSDAKLDGKGKVRRPEPRWMDDVQTDRKIKGIKGWIRNAQNRSESMHVIRNGEVKLQGCNTVVVVVVVVVVEEEEEEEEEEYHLRKKIIPPTLPLGACVYQRHVKLLESPNPANYCTKEIVNIFYFEDVLQTDSLTN